MSRNLLVSSAITVLEALQRPHHTPVRAWEAAKYSSVGSWTRSPDDGDDDPKKINESHAKIQQKQRQNSAKSDKKEATKPESKKWQQYQHVSERPHSSPSPLQKHFSRHAQHLMGNNATSKATPRDGSGGVIGGGKDSSAGHRGDGSVKLDSQKNLEKGEKGSKEEHLVREAEVQKTPDVKKQSLKESPTSSQQLPPSILPKTKVEAKTDNPLSGKPFNSEQKLKPEGDNISKPSKNPREKRNPNQISIKYILRAVAKKYQGEIKQVTGLDKKEIKSAIETTRKKDTASVKPSNNDQKQEIKPVFETERNQKITSETPLGNEQKLKGKVNETPKSQIPYNETDNTKNNRNQTAIQKQLKAKPNKETVEIKHEIGLDKKEIKPTFETERKQNTASVKPLNNDQKQEIKPVFETEWKQKTTSVTQLDNEEKLENKVNETPKPQTSYSKTDNTKNNPNQTAIQKQLKAKPNKETEEIKHEAGSNKKEIKSTFKSEQKQSSVPIKPTNNDQNPEIKPASETERKQNTASVKPLTNVQKQEIKSTFDAERKQNTISQAPSNNDHIQNNKVQEVQKTPTLHGKTEKKSLKFDETSIQHNANPILEKDKEVIEHKNRSRNEEIKLVDDTERKQGELCSGTMEKETINLQETFNKNSQSCKKTCGDDLGKEIKVSSSSVSNNKKYVDVCANYMKDPPLISSSLAAKKEKTNLCLTEKETKESHNPEKKGQSHPCRIEQERVKDTSENKKNDDVCINYKKDPPLQNSQAVEKMTENDLCTENKKINECDTKKKERKIPCKTRKEEERDSLNINKKEETDICKIKEKEVSNSRKRKNSYENVTNKSESLCKIENKKEMWSLKSIDMLCKPKKKVKGSKSACYELCKLGTKTKKNENDPCPIEKKRAKEPCKPKEKEEKDPCKTEHKQVKSLLENKNTEDASVNYGKDKTLQNLQAVEERIENYPCTIENKDIKKYITHNNKIKYQQEPSNYSYDSIRKYSQQFINLKRNYSTSVFDSKRKSFISVRSSKLMSFKSPCDSKEKSKCDSKQKSSKSSFDQKIKSPNIPCGRKTKTSCGSVLIPSKSSSKQNLYKSPCDLKKSANIPCGMKKNPSKSLCGYVLKPNNSSSRVKQKTLRSPCDLSKKISFPCGLKKEPSKSKRGSVLMSSNCSASAEQKSSSIPCGLKKESNALCGSKSSKSSPNVQRNSSKSPYNLERKSSSCTSSQDRNSIETPRKEHEAKRTVSYESTITIKKWKRKCIDIKELLSPSTEKGNTSSFTTQVDTTTLNKIKGFQSSCTNIRKEELNPSIGSVQKQSEFSCWRQQDSKSSMGKEEKESSKTKNFPKQEGAPVVQQTSFALFWPFFYFANSCGQSLRTGCKLPTGRKSDCRLIPGDKKPPPCKPKKNHWSKLLWLTPLALLGLLYYAIFGKKRQVTIKQTACAEKDPNEKEKECVSPASSCSTFEKCTRDAGPFPDSRSRSSNGEGSRFLRPPSSRSNFVDVPYKDRCNRYGSPTRAKDSSFSAEETKPIGLRTVVDLTCPRSPKTQQRAQLNSDRMNTVQPSDSRKLRGISSRVGKFTALEDNSKGKHCNYNVQSVNLTRSSEMFYRPRSSYRSSENRQRHLHRRYSHGDVRRW